MKKIIFFALCIFAVVPRAAGAEQITDYNVDVTVQPDAAITVRETIHYDFGDVQRHGIIRDIPVSYKNSVGDTRTIAVRVQAVTDSAGASHPFTTATEKGVLHIKIGDAQTTVRGPQTYVIVYTVMGAMNYFETHDELYWNAIGLQWAVPIVRGTVTVHAPMITKTQCFAGALGATASCTTAHGDERAVTFTQEYLPPAQGMTVVVGMPVGTVTRPTAQDRLWKYLRDNWPYGVPFIVAPLMWGLWRTRGRDPEGRGTVVPEYDAPDSITPMEAVMVLRDGVSPDSIAAEIIHLAVHGYLTIAKTQHKTLLSTQHDYTFTRTDKRADDLPSHQQTILTALFDGQPQRMMADLKQTFYTTVQAAQRDVRTHAVRRGWYVSDPATVVAQYMTIAIGVFIAGLLLTYGVGGMAYVVSGAVSAVIIGVFGVVMPRRTKAGAVMRERVAGLKMYITTAEKDRIAFHNAPEKTPAQFEKLLPYAMVVGAEEAWAEQFKDVYTQPPQWYDGGGAPFAPAMLASDMHAFRTQAHTTLATPPSASAGHSGFSGGGSGGGFGGGGGGSW